MTNKPISLFTISLSYLIGACIIVYQLMGRIMFQLNDIQLDRSGDGFKNYYAFAWQYRHEDGLFFKGMQYPYGDLLSYADGQPLMTLFLIGLKKIGLDFSGHELLLVQGLPLLSILIGCFFLHKVIRHYNIPTWWSIITVLACVILSPQIFRFGAHFSLSYMFCFPSIWYLYVKFDAQLMSSFRYCLITIIALVAYAFLHPYHLLMGSTFILALFVIKLLYKNVSWPLLMSGLFPIFIYLFINFCIDPYLDRPQNPWGAWNFKTEVSDLLPFYGWFDALFSPTIPLRKYYNEGYSYLGILVFLFPILFLLKKYRKSSPQFTNSDFPYTTIMASVLVLLFSMGIHILLTDHKVLDWISTLKQFRALGRFSWPFYYVGFLGLSIYFYRIIEPLKNKYLKSFLFVFVIAMWIFDGLYYTKESNNNVLKYNAKNQLYDNLEIQNAIGNKINLNDFQAILPLPVSMEGAEKITPSDSWFSKTQGIPFAFQTGLPIIGAYMSRTSLSRIMKQYQLGSSAYVDKTVIKDFPNRKNLLTIIAKEDLAVYSDIANKSKFLGETQYVNIYSSSIDSLSKVIYLNRDSLPQPVEPIFYNNYIAYDNHGLKSDGSLLANGTTTLADINIMDTDTIVLSIWYRIDTDHSSIPSFDIKLADNKHNTISNISYRDIDMKRMEIIDNWVQIKKEVHLPHHASSLKWTVNTENLYMDHALISMKKPLFWKALNDDFCIYNHYITQVKN